jgi:hypothetical protein
MHILYGMISNMCIFIKLYIHYNHIDIELNAI